METRYRKIKKSELKLVPDFIISLAKSQGKKIVFDKTKKIYLIAQIENKNLTAGNFRQGFYNC